MLIYRLFVTLWRDGVKHDFSLKYEAKDEQDAEDAFRKVLIDLNSGVEYAEDNQEPYLWVWEDDQDTVCFDPRDVLSVEWMIEEEKVQYSSPQYSTVSNSWIANNLQLKGDY